jgi:hypothetical protein
LGGCIPLSSALLFSASAFGSAYVRNLKHLESGMKFLEFESLSHKNVINCPDNSY